jgi:hypothetical protein
MNQIAETILEGINKINVTLDPSDTYTVQFFRSTVKGDDLKNSDGRRLA